MFKDQFKGLKLHQKVNHFPGMSNIYRKNNLGRNLNKMRKDLPTEYNFYPRTWLLPLDQRNFMNEFKELKKLKKMMGKSKNVKYQQFYEKYNELLQKTYIAKPEDSGSGKGIFLITSPNEVPKDTRYVIQEYLNEPFLYNGLKFDFRIYVLILGCDPLRVLMFKDGLVRFATQKYEKVNEKNKYDPFMHLTNFAINKENPGYNKGSQSFKEEKNQHKRSIRDFFIELEKQQINTRKIWREIQFLTVKTLCSIQPILKHNYNSIHADDPYNQTCFEILGFDVLLDKNLKPWLLEVNHSPSFHTGSSVDLKVKSQLMFDTFTLLNLSKREKLRLVKLQGQNQKIRTRTGKRVKLNEGSMRNKCLDERDEYIRGNLGNYDLIYPPKSKSLLEKYNEILGHAEHLYHKFTGTRELSRGYNFDRPMKLLSKKSVDLFKYDIQEAKKIYGLPEDPEIEKKIVRSLTKPNPFVEPGSQQDLRKSMKNLSPELKSEIENLEKCENSRISTIKLRAMLLKDSKRNNRIPNPLKKFKNGNYALQKNLLLKAKLSDSLEDSLEKSRMNELQKALTPTHKKIGIPGNLSRLKQRIDRFQNQIAHKKLIKMSFQDKESMLRNTHQIRSFHPQVNDQGSIAANHKCYTKNVGGMKQNYRVSSRYSTFDKNSRFRARDGSSNTDNGKNGSSIKVRASSQINFQIKNLRKDSKMRQGAHRSLRRKRPKYKDPYLAWDPFKTFDKSYRQRMAKLGVKIIKAKNYRKQLKFLKINKYFKLQLHLKGHQNLIRFYYNKKFIPSLQVYNFTEFYLRNSKMSNLTIFLFSQIRAFRTLEQEVVHSHQNQNSSTCSFPPSGHSCASHYSLGLEAVLGEEAVQGQEAVQGEEASLGSPATRQFEYSHLEHRRKWHLRLSKPH